MASTIVIQPLPKGTPAYEQKREAFLQELANKIPPEYRLPAQFFEDPPLSVLDVPRNSGILTQKELHITEDHDATALAAAIASGLLTSVEVTKAFCKRAAITHQVTICLTDFFEDEALDTARRLDEHLQRTGKPVGPLHGVPVSVKEHIPIKGHHASEGFLATRYLCSTDAAIIKSLRAAGAVLFAKTTQPQSIMHLETDGFHGRTLNPHNINLSAGGSSGGEGALLAMRGSPLGIGTDLAGSIRAPAAFNGLIGYKPTADYFALADCFSRPVATDMIIPASLGPMAHSIRDCDLLARVHLKEYVYVQDPRYVPIPWTGLSTPIPKVIKIGILKTDGSVTPQPPVLQALEWAEHRLTSVVGVVLKPFVQYRAEECFTNARKAYWADAGLPVKEIPKATGEPELPLTTYALDAVKDLHDRPLDALQIVEMQAARQAFRKAASQHWAEQDVDFVLCPIYIGPAPPHGTCKYWGYTSYWNYVDCPAVTLPTPFRVERERTAYPEDFEPLSVEDEKSRALWPEHDYTGAPIALQLVARRFHDNQLFGALGIIKDAFGLR